MVDKSHRQKRLKNSTWQVYCSPTFGDGWKIANMWRQLVDVVCSVQTALMSKDGNMSNLVITSIVPLRPEG